MGAYAGSATVGRGRVVGVGVGVGIGVGVGVGFDDVGVLRSVIPAVVRSVVPAVNGVVHGLVVFSC